MRLVKKRNFNLGAVLVKRPQIITGIVLMLMIVVFTIVSPYTRDGQNVFISWRNLTKVIENMTIVVIGGLAMMMVMLGGGIDLSATSILRVSTVVFGVAITSLELPAVVAILLCLAAGTIMGIINSIIIVELKIPPFLATLASSFVFEGVAYTIVGGQQFSVRNPLIMELFGYNTILGIPILIFWLLAFCVFTFIIIRKTKLGRNLQAIGGNEIAAKNSGVNIRKIKYFTYAFMGLASAFISMTLVGRLQTAAPNYGTDYYLDYITVAVLGGTGFAGTGGSIVGLLFGALLVAFFRNGLDILGTDIYIAGVLRGLLILVAMIASVVAGKQRSKYEV